MSECYLCGKSPAEKPLFLKDSFTAHSLAACPWSKKLCARCEFAINTRASYWSQSKQKWSVLYARNWAWLYQGETLLSPVFDGEIDGFPVVKNLATRKEIRDWILNPPSPPFTICIPESGQKHTLFLAKENYSQSLFAVQFETDVVWIEKEKFTRHLECFEQLLGLNATKTEIVSGNYKSQFLLSAIINPEFECLDAAIAALRGKRYLELINHVAQYPEPPPVEEPKP